MLPEQQQRILGYFLEEARDHLNTIEQGLLNLQDTLNDPEMINEVFRAAHSIKGGAAMLGLNSIQHTAHRLEDCFKILKENPIQVDQKLESLFLSVADTLKALLEQLSTPFGLSEDTARTLMLATEPVVKALTEHIEILVQKGSAGVVSAVPEKAAYMGGVTTAIPVSATPQTARPASITSPVTVSQDTWIEEFKNQVISALREMLQTFKQPATEESRAVLQQSCQRLVKLGEPLKLSNWCELCKASHEAIANPDNTYLTLAKIVITEIKQAQELVLQGREAEVTVSQQLAALAPIPSELEELLAIIPEETPPQEEVATVDNVWETATAEAEADDSLTDLFGSTSVEAEADNSLTDLFGGSASVEPAPETETSDFLFEQITETPTPVHSQFTPDEEATLTIGTIDHHGPEVGLAELNTLADIFNGETPELEEPWQQDQIEDTADHQLGINESEIEDADNELADFLSLDQNSSNGDRQTNTNNFTEDLNLLFEENFTEKEPLGTQALTANTNTTNNDLEPNLDFSSEDDELADLLTLTVDSIESPSSDHPLSAQEEHSTPSEDLDADIFALPQTTAPTAEDELDNFWNQTETASTLPLETVKEQDIAKALDDSLLFTAATEVSAEAQQLNTDSNLDIEDFDLTFFQPDQPFDALLSDAEEDNIFTDLGDSYTPTSSSDLTQQPETLDFLPDLTTQPTETSTDLDIFGNLAENNNEDITIDATYIQPEVASFSVDNLFGEDNSLDFSLGEQTQSANQQASEDLMNTLADEQPSLADEFSFSQTIIQEDLIFNLDELTENPSQQESEIDLDATFGGLDLGESTQTTIQDYPLFDTEDVLKNPSEQESEIDLDATFGGLDLETPAETTIQDYPLFGAEDVLETPSEQESEIDLDATFGELDLGEEETTADLAANLLTTEANNASAPTLAEAEQEETETTTSAVDEFGDLEALVGEQEETETTASAVDEFADLEALVGEQEEPVTPVAQPEQAETTTSAIDEFADLEALLDEEHTSEPAPKLEVMQEEDFAALEALLAPDTSEATATPAIAQPMASQGAIARNISSTPAAIKDEFSDLEELLAHANQTLHNQPMSVIPNPAKGIRPTRRVMREETMKVPVKQLDEMSNLVGELVVNRNTLEQDHERLRQSLDNLLVQVQQLSDVGARMQELYERSLLEASLLASRRPKDNGDSRANDMDLSELELDRFTPFHTLSQEMIEFIVRVRESASDIDFVTEETERVARQFRQVTSQLQEGLTRARMVPFSQVIDRLRRGVRDNAIKCGKQVELKTEGTENLIDKMILDHLTDPLTHMLNNAIAHGIETPDVRQAAGKPPVGVITIRAYQQGNQTIISVSDDGAGIDHEKVKAKAIQKGIITPEQAQAMSRLDVYDLLFLPSFSTVEQVNDLSGRGVGMDVVRTDISEIRGAVSTDSAIGRGTTFTIRLPVTLSICKALSCISDKARIAFPMDGVEDTLDIPVKNIHQDSDGQQYIYWRDTTLPFKPLKEILALSRQIIRGSVYGGTRDDDMVSVVVVRSGNTLVGLQVDQVLSEQEIVIKQFEGPAPKPNGVAGATVLGDGRIMPIADVLEIIDIFQGKRSKPTGSTPWNPKTLPPISEPPAAAKIDPTVLIVDDSITVRELLSLTFNKAGYRVEQARDGQEAWDKLRSGLPCDIVFCDIEMPRCDGLELLSRIQKDNNLNHLPIAMLTSRGADKHRQMAVQLGASGYFTKPYLEEALLEAASRMLKGEKLVTA
ncbi:MAG TPA: response regulator [Nostocaceae cyanobacterium]|nr:response regulator [Nostocaceae cyanobacterium]